MEGRGEFFPLSAKFQKIGTATIFIRRENVGLHLYLRQI